MSAEAVALPVGLEAVALPAERAGVDWVAGHPADRSHQGPSAEDRDAVALRVLVSQSSSFLEENEKEHASALLTLVERLFLVGFIHTHGPSPMRKRRPA